MFVGVDGVVTSAASAAAATAPTPPPESACGGGVASMAAARGGNGVENSNEEAGVDEEVDAAICGAGIGGDSVINEGGFTGCDIERGRKGGVEAAPSPGLATVDDIL